MKQVDRMNDEKALTFVNIGFFEASLLIYLGRLDLLADKALTPWDASKQELIDIMKYRLKPIQRGQTTGAKVHVK